MPGSSCCVDPRPLAAILPRPVEELLEHLREAGTGVPGELRWERRRAAERDGIEVSAEMHDELIRKARDASAA